MLQLFFIFIGQYFLEIGNYFVVILIPLGMTVANFFAAIVIFESFAQVERREKLRSQFRKSKIDVSNLEKFLNFPVTKPLIIVSIIFVSFFFTTFYISATFLPNTISFIVAENTSAIICLLIANLIEKKYGRVQRF